MLWEWCSVLPVPVNTANGFKGLWPGQDGLSSVWGLSGGNAEEWAEMVKKFQNLLPVG